MYEPSRRPLLAVAMALSLVADGALAASLTEVDLSRYVLSGTYSLPAPAMEASAVTYNADAGTLFVLGDEGDALVQVTKTGALLDTMTLTGFQDTEGLTYVGGGQFVITEERIRDAFLLTYVPGATVDRSALQRADLGSSVGNIGIEGISYDPRDGSFVTVKEKTPQEVNRHVIDFAGGTATTASLFAPALGVDDLADVQVLGRVPALIGTADENNLLLLSQESALLLETDRLGNILSQFALGALSLTAEGVTIDDDGIIYIVAENGTTPTLYTLTPVPLPPAVMLFGSGLIALVAAKRRHRSA